MRDRVFLFAAAALIVTALALIVSFSLLPAPPIAPTPTFPQGIDLPEKLPRIPR